jgi:hypothetical protein
MFVPICLVQVDRQEEASFVAEQGIDAHDEFAAVVIVASEMPTNIIIGQRKEPLVLTQCTLDAGLFADALKPFVCASRCVS